MTSPTILRECFDALTEPFSPQDIDFLPRPTKSGDKALALPYIDARAVMARLDTAVGADNWCFDFEPLGPDGKRVKGKLTVYGVTKCDAGEAGDEDEPLKSAVSDALKRCAVHFGVGRYLYHLQPIWAPYDAITKRFKERPTIGNFADAVDQARGVVKQASPKSAPKPADAPGASADKPAPASPATWAAALSALRHEDDALATAIQTALNDLGWKPSRRLGQLLQTEFLPAPSVAAWRKAWKRLGAAHASWDRCKGQGLADDYLRQTATDAGHAPDADGLAGMTVDGWITVAAALDAEGS